MTSCTALLMRADNSGRARLQLLEDVADQAATGARVVLGHGALALVSPAVLLAELAHAHVLPHVHLARQRGCGRPNTQGCIRARTSG